MSSLASLSIPPASTASRDGLSGARSPISIPSWGTSAASSSRTPIPGLPIGSHSSDSSSSASSSRNFLVPIGATGARQKLSIGSASQRRRLAASDEVRWSGPAANASQTPDQQQQQSQQQPHQHPQQQSGSIYAQGANDSNGSLARSQSDLQNAVGHPTDMEAVPTSTELLQQAAMQRLSSQRVLPSFRSSSALNLETATATVRPGSTASSKPANITSTLARTTAAAEPDSRASVSGAVPGPRKSSLDRAAARAGKASKVSGSMAPIPASPSANSTDVPAASKPASYTPVIPSPSRSMTLAEQYKQSMLQRDNVRPATTAAAAAATVPLSGPAPTLDVLLPNSGLFSPELDVDASGQKDPRSVPGSDPDDGRNGSKRSVSSTTEESDKSIGSFEGAYDYNLAVHTTSFQSSYDEAMAIQDRIRTGIIEDSAYGGLFEGGTSTEDASVAATRAPRSYLALWDDDEEEKDGNRPHAGQTGSIVSAQHRDAAAAVSRADEETPKLRSRAAFASSSQPASSSPTMGVGTWPISPTTPTARSDFAAGRGSGHLPRENSLTTLRSPPDQLEHQPGPTGDAALEAGALAAIPTHSPLSASFPASTFQDSSSSWNRESPAASPVLARPPAATSLDEEATAASAGVEAGRWRRSNDAAATLSPIQRSRFSEASTIRSDSRAATRNEDRYSGFGSVASSDDGFEDESSDSNILPISAWNEVDNALRRFRDRSVNNDAGGERGNLLRTVLLPFLALEAETANVDGVGVGPYSKGKARRALFFDWIRFLLLELQHVQTSADRGAILESIACIIESRNFSANILAADPEDEARFSSVFGHILSYAIGELNKKGVYQNTLIFSGRLLAVAFFRVEGVASKLLRALPVNRFALERVAKEFGWSKKRPSQFERFVNRFPASLRPLCYRDSRGYLKMLDNESTPLQGAGVDGAGDPDDDRYLVRQPEVEVEMSGNWLRRWQSDDSELFFSFCRSYHRQLACLFASSRSLEAVSKHFFGGPGYAHLATCVHQKCLALVLRVILSVTTLSSQKNFNPAGETANVLSGSTAGKPRILEAANRRCTSIVVDIVRAPAGSNMIFAPMLGLHIKALVKRTSLYDVQGVFCLLDWLDGVLSHMDSADLLNEGLIDVSFVIETIGLLLESADHALALMRTIAFCYANFGVLTATTENRVHFCEQILLKPAIFHKLFLSWSFTIRAYYLHLLVFRLARIKDFPIPKDDVSGRTAIRVVRLFHQRLEELRKRHDQLSPETDSSSDENRSDDTRSRKSRASTFVSTIKHTSMDGGKSGESSSPTRGTSEGRAKAEKLASTASNSNGSKPADGEGKNGSKTKGWLKAFRTGGKTGARPDANGTSNGSPGNTVSSVTTASTESDDESRAFDSTKSTPRTSFDASSDAMSDVSTLAGSIRGGRNGNGRNGAFEFDIREQQQSSSKQPSAQTNKAMQDAGGALPTGHDAGIAKDTVFDLQSSPHAHLPTPGRTPQSPRISRAFSRRASMLPGAASELVAGLAEGEEGELPPVPDVPAQHLGLGLTNVSGDRAELYDEALHVYAVQSLREYEQTVQEHDEFFASLPPDQSTQVPRLPVNWPAMWSSTGE
ncbi:hypothetical protein BCV70DRAFT_176825 [Testicularia cyperi]|uniref:DUF1765-domain-containing protein n=1 Tax=Testicularia cyperi TaxID=1882483 RepID=A0A317XP69_9BASI|nr:hypothetical protein BCV70DRAFT_176825 [Testicularia cyperi]